MLSIIQLTAIILLLASSFYFVYYAIDKKERKKHAKRIFLSIIGFALGLLLLLNLLNPFLLMQDTTAAPQDSSLVKYLKQAYTQKTEPLICEQNGLVYWRELRVYEIDTAEGHKKISTITLNIKNNGNKAVTNIIVKEKLPSAVATVPEELIDFSIKPLRFEQGSVVVDWLFENIEPEETKSVSYTVEKELDEEVLNEYEAPKVVSQQLGDETHYPAEERDVAAQAGSVDYSLLGLVAVIVVLGGVIAILARRQ
ncbi:MAG: hypothetical protein ABH803_02870 [Candidatus Micrarchaeota archaeon]